MHMPYQCMTKCGDILVAARGSSIDSFKFQDGSLLSTWTTAAANHKADLPSESAARPHLQVTEPSSIDGAESDTPPAKKRKLSLSEQIPLPAQDEAKNGTDGTNGRNGKKKQNNRSTAVSSGLNAPAITVLASTTDGKHVIAVTGEDKCIRVFEHVLDDGQSLNQLSQRTMPKRPCTLRITEDNSTIISADKFGDVYSLPLLFSEASTPIDPETREHTPTSKPFTPAANELTIHSQRNRKALEQQKRQSNQISEKSEPSFEHKLLLGHVSMLTDIALVTLEKKSYIITADRDEHIRISRGIPQAHIIEGYCLGHTDFITRLCIPEDRPDILLSGGGDDEIYVWNWISSKLLSRTKISGYVKSVGAKSNIAENAVRSNDATKSVISGLYHTRGQTAEGHKDYIIVTCEGVSAIFLFNLHANDNALRCIQTVELPGNPLAVITSPGSLHQVSINDLIVSIDNVHQPGSTKELRTEAPETPRLLRMQLREDGLIGTSALFAEPRDEVNATTHTSDNAGGQLSNLLYNLENLRKRDDGDGPEE